jgi:hypothetical protein
MSISVIIFSDDDDREGHGNVGILRTSNEADPPLRGGLHKKISPSTYNPLRLMMTELDIETSVYYAYLNRLIARKDFINLNYISETALKRKFKLFC